MTIREVLEADWTVAMFSVTVRDKKSSKYIMQYYFGRDVKPGLSEKFLYESPIGNVYGDGKNNTLYIKEIIQHCQLDNLPRSKEGLVGVFTEKIPKEILELPVHFMLPGYLHARSSSKNDLHGYRFECYVDYWNGIEGENKQMDLEEIIEL